MALSCSRLCTRLSLMRVWGLSSNSVAAGFYSHHGCHGFCQSSSSVTRFLLCRHYSKVRRGLGRYVASRLQWANDKYESFLKRRFPRFFLLYHTFVEGFKMLFRDAKEVRSIKAKMLMGGVKFEDLPYREMEKLRQFRRDLIKAVPLVMISIPPFANYLVFLLMYLFPRQLLIPHFWNPKQQVEFRQIYHALRVRHHQPVLRTLEGLQGRPGHLEGLLKTLCFKVQHGGHPKVSEVLPVKSLFSSAPLGLTQMSAVHMRKLSPLLFLTPHLPGFLIGRRLNSHALELLQLDRALNRLGPHQLSDSELRQACFVRGINSDALSPSQCRQWLSQWLQVSSSLKESELSLLLHCIVFLSANYPKAQSGH